MPVFLLDIYGKGNKANLSRSEKNELRKLLTDLPRVWRDRKIRKLRSKR